MAYFFEKYHNYELSDFPIGSATITQLPHITPPIINELSINGIYVSYFKEENIGGKSIYLINQTINHHKFSAKEIYKDTDKKVALKFNILIRLISLLDKFFIAYYELQSYFKDSLFGEYLSAGRGTTVMNSLFRYYYYIFDDYCQKVLYNISFFLVKWLNNLILGEKVIK